MEYFKIFSQNYANGITALAAIGAILLSAITLYFLRKEFFAKYQPYVVPIVNVQKIREGLECSVNISPRNIGPHPCKFKLSAIKLNIGDEQYETPPNQEWMLLGQEGIGVKMPAGHINEVGIAKIRNNNYRTNRIELQFVLHTKSIHDNYEKSEEFAFEIDVLSDEPQALFRPEWRRALT